MKTPRPPEAAMNEEALLMALAIGATIVAPMPKTMLSGTIARRDQAGSAVNPDILRYLYVDRFVIEPTAEASDEYAAEDVDIGNLKTVPLPGQCHTDPSRRLLPADR